jgi:hypothetical protein
MLAYEHIETRKRTRAPGGLIAPCWASTAPWISRIHERVCLHEQRRQRGFAGTFIGAPAKAPLRPPDATGRRLQLLPALERESRARVLAGLAAEPEYARL